MERFLYGLLISEEDENIDLEAYEDTSALNDLHNNYLKNLKIDYSLDDIVHLLEEKIRVEV